MSPAPTPKPNPGSNEARALGCTCAVLDNHHGIGSGPWWMRVDCPVHGETPQKALPDDWFTPTVFARVP